MAISSQCFILCILCKLCPIQLQTVKVASRVSHVYRAQQYLEHQSRQLHTGGNLARHIYLHWSSALTVICFYQKRNRGSSSWCRIDGATHRSSFTISYVSTWGVSSSHTHAGDDSEVSSFIELCWKLPFYWFQHAAECCSWVWCRHSTITALWVRDWWEKHC